MPGVHYLEYEALDGQAPRSVFSSTMSRPLSLQLPTPNVTNGPQQPLLPSQESYCAFSRSTISTYAVLLFLECSLLATFPHLESSF